MSDYEKLQYANARLGLASMMNDVPEVEKWTEHVRYWVSHLTTASLAEEKMRC